MDQTNTEPTTDEQAEGISETVDPTGLPLIESLDEDGYLWKVQVIRAGVSLNQNEYPLTTLHEAIPAYDGVSVFPEHDKRNRSFGKRLGYIVDPKPNSYGIEGTFEIDRGKPEVRESVRHAWDVQRRTGKPTLGFSHTIDAGGFKARRRQPRGWTVERISRVSSVDLVMEPAAGGALLGPLSESTEYIPDTLKEALVDVQKELARVRAGETLSDEDMNALVEAVGWKEVRAALTEAQDKADEKATSKLAETVKKNHGKQDDGITESRLAEMERKAEERIALMESKALLSDVLSEAKLPQPFKDAIKADFSGRVFEADELEARIERDAKLYEASMPAGKKPTLSGGPEVTEDQREKHQKALDGLIWGKTFDDVTPFNSIKEAYRQITGTTLAYNDYQLAESVILDAKRWAEGHLAESVTSSTWGQMLGDSIRRRALDIYGTNEYNSWRILVGPNIVPLQDFRTNRRMRMGGYGELPTVSEGAPYQPLTTPGDEEATYSPAKKGGTEDLTMETIANDDVGAVRRIPRELGEAAAWTLYKAVWLDTIRDNATATYDSTALFHTDHSNIDTSSSSLTAAQLLTVENAMRDQSRYGVTDRVMGAANTPRILAIPNELRDTAYRLNESSVAVSSAADDTEPNIFRNRYTIVVIDDFTNSGDWYAFADPARVPTLEVGFLGGRDMPELFVQDAQNVGSMFDADKVTYKIRFIYGIGILDHRGAYFNDV